MIAIIHQIASWIGYLTVSFLILRSVIVHLPKTRDRQEIDAFNNRQRELREAAATMPAVMAALSDRHGPMVRSLSIISADGRHELTLEDRGPTRVDVFVEDRHTRKYGTQSGDFIHLALRRDQLVAAGEWVNAMPTDAVERT